VGPRADDLQTAGPALPLQICITNDDGAIAERPRRHRVNPG
jgi:hypothetical protein